MYTSVVWPWKYHAHPSCYFNLFAVLGYPIFENFPILFRRMSDVSLAMFTNII